MERVQSVTWTDVARNGLHAKSSEVDEARQDEVLSKARGSYASGTVRFNRKVR